VLEHVADHALAVAALRGVEARLPVDVPRAARLEADDHLHRHVLVVREDVAREVRQIAVRERLLALGVRLPCDLPPHWPAVTVRVHAARVALCLYDVRGDAAVEVGEAMLAEDFLKGRTHGAKGLENLRPVHKVGDGPPGIRVTRPAEHDDRGQSEPPHRGRIVQ
jgi:hypothetical protein